MVELEATDGEMEKSFSQVSRETKQPNGGVVMLEEWNGAMDAEAF